MLKKFGQKLRVFNILSHMYANSSGISISGTRGRLANMGRFLREYLQFKKMLAASPQAGIKLSPSYPILHDYTDSAGVAKGNYFNQDLWAARKIFKAAPTDHIDIGSRVDGFVAHVLSFRPVTIIDIRPLESSIPGLTFMQADATNLESFPDNSVESLSSLHAAEHFGLGRYGDPLDPEGHIKFMRAMARVLKPGGRLYFGGPIGRERIEFNAHRVLNARTYLAQFTGLKLLSFSAVNDAGDFVPNANLDDYNGASFSCGLYEFTKEV